MKTIVHISISGPYTDELSYQENYLTKYHVKLGFCVYLIASEWKYDSNGKLIKSDRSEYIDRNGVHVIRLQMKGKDDINKRIRRFKGLLTYLDRIKPDIIFNHGCQNVEENTVLNYCKKNPQTVLYVDNHSDFSNSASNWISKNIQHKILWKYYAQKINPYVKKFYGVLPARVDFLINMYGLPKEKVKLLVMGADDDLVNLAQSQHVREHVRASNSIESTDFLIVTGGKIDSSKKQVLQLMDAVNLIDIPNVKLLVFGSVIDELKDEVNNRLSDRVIYIGWINSVESYDYFASADLVVFPGRHSVFWEQVAGQGIPMICKYWAGTTHVDCGGNVKFLKEDSVNEIIKAIYESKLNYNEMLVAATNCKKRFSYSEISKLSIEL